jgi:hypothetical protein
MSDTRSQLFPCPGALPVPMRPEPAIVTPLGSVVFTASLFGATLSPEDSNLVLTLPDGGHIFCWRSDRFVLELLRCRPVLNDYSRDQCDERIANLWRLQALAGGVAPRFECGWAPDCHWNDAGPDGGQGLFAWVWSNENWDVAIGAEDGEWLSRRAALGDWIPARWAAELVQQAPAFAGWVGPKGPGWDCRTGFRMQFPELEPGECCQAQFVVAWANQQERQEKAQLSFAVEVTPQQILAGCGL